MVSTLSFSLAIDLYDLNYFYLRLTVSIVFDMFFKGLCLKLVSFFKGVFLLSITASVDLRLLKGRGDFGFGLGGYGILIISSRAGNLLNKS